jgi:hypothetical protein
MLEVVIPSAAWRNLKTLKNLPDRGVFRDISRELMIKMKIAPAVQRKSVKQLLIDLPREHIEELEKKGLLPKGK